MKNYFTLPTRLQLCGHLEFIAQVLFISQLFCIGQWVRNHNFHIKKKIDPFIILKLNKQVQAGAMGKLNLPKILTGDLKYLYHIKGTTWKRMLLEQMEQN